MALTKDDLKQIKTVMREEVSDVVETEVGNLAAMVKKEFDANTAAHKKMVEDNQKAHEQIRKDISHLEFMATEMVRRDELIEVKQRLSRIEAKLGIAK
jgi:hypothetical protein